jgi:hypothetical protein
MKYFINFINLERDKQKKINMETLLQNHNLQYERVEGYDFKNNNLPTYKIINSIIEPNIKEMSITFTHFKVFEKYDNDNYNDNDYIIVMEDDISFDYINDFKKEIDECLLKIPLDWNYINLHCNNKFTIKKHIDLYKNNIYYKTIDNSNRNKDNSAGCYLIKIFAIKKILKNIKDNNIYTFDFKFLYPSICNILKSIDTGYYYTKPIISIVENNINTLGIQNPHDYMSNKLIKEFWNK